MIEIVARSGAMREALRLAGRVAPTNANVLITGESGAGKDAVAQFVHEHSARAARDLVKIDCASLPAGLLEAELFGYERGAFTGATAAKPGRLEAADGGTLVLDEVGGPPLCALENFPYEGARVRLDPRDMLTLASDGITEAMNRAGALYGRARLRALLDSATRRFLRAPS